MTLLHTISEKRLYANYSLILKFYASMDFWFYPYFFLFRIPITRRGGLPSQLQTLIQGLCCSQQCPWSLVQSWREWTMELGAIGGGLAWRKGSVSARMYWRTTRKPQDWWEPFQNWALWSKEVQEIALPRVLSAPGWNPELLRLSESTPWTDAVTQEAITKALFCFALRWPHWWVQVSYCLFFSFLFLSFGRS